MVCYATHASFSITKGSSDRTKNIALGTITPWQSSLLNLQTSSLILICLNNWTCLNINLSPIAGQGHCVVVVVVRARHHTLTVSLPLSQYLSLSVRYYQGLSTTGIFAILQVTQIARGKRIHCGTRLIFTAWFNWISVPCWKISSKYFRLV